MSTVKLLKQAKKSIATRDEARSVATRAHNDAEKYLKEALLLSRTVSESMEIYRLSDDRKFSEVAMRKAITLLGTSAKHLWDLALIVEGDGYDPHDDEFRKKKEIILSKISVDWLMSLEKKVPRQFDSELRRRFSKELRQRFEQEARAATSCAEYELVCEHYQNLPVDTSGTWGEDGWKPYERPARSYPVSYSGPHF
jgi:hypothetical protein